MRTLFRLVIIPVMLLGVASAPLPASNFSPGVHYFELSEPQPVQTGDKIEVLELFWYGCPHCYDLEPVMEKWLKNKPKNVGYVRLPAVLRDSWAFHAQVFYTFEALDLLGTLHQAFFDEIHKRKNRVRNLAELTPFLETHGVAKQTFLDAFNSFAVDSKMRHASMMSRRYQATGVPTIVVAGKYRLTVSSAGGHSQLLELVNFLVSKAAGERG